MNSFLVTSQDDLRVLITNTATKLGLSEAVIEKDYWVSFVLDYLFHHSRRKNAFTFKGGTSLTKCFGLIERFSEDVDLILDWRTLGYSKNQPWEIRSNTQQNIFNKELNRKTSKFLKNVLLTEIDTDFKELLKSGFRFFINREDPQSILFEYPKIFSSSYLTQTIKLEIGCLGTWSPAKRAEIKPIIAEAYPNVFQKKSKIRTVSPERTFWEKATILHHEVNRPKNSRMPVRYARHYYDLYKMAKSPVKTSALADRALLKKVVDFKIKFYPRSWAKYSDAISGKIRLVPDAYRVNEIKTDYKAMEEMIYGNYPRFGELITELEELENEINRKII